MKVLRILLVFFFAGVGLANAQNSFNASGNFLAKAGKSKSTTIICSENAMSNVKLAAKEIRRYVYLRTGNLLKIAEYASGNTISFNIDTTYEEQQFALKSNGNSMVISGGSDIAILYGAYAFAEKMGVSFQIDGDIIPDNKIPFCLPVLDEINKPLFKLRGLLPFHDFPEGPDWWTTDDWKSISGQITKMRMNFIGLHTYPVRNKDLGPEPTVWIGMPEDVNEDGTVNVAGKTSWYTTSKFMPYGCYAPGKTGSFSYGADQLFPTDDYGSELNGADDFPFPKTPQACVDMANRAGRMLNDVFTNAHNLGIKIAIGTESPLDVPDVIVEKLRNKGLDPENPLMLQKLYEGTFLRIKRAFPVDYYWIWGHEGEIDEKYFVPNIESARAAIKAVDAPFQLGICGWGWTAGHFPAFDKVFPNDVFFSAISHAIGTSPVSPNYAGLENRLKFAIPWAEDDASMTALQLLAGRMRRDAFDAHDYGCDGLFCLHWRTRVISPNISALAQAAWKIGDWAYSSDNKSESIKNVTAIGGQSAAYLNNQIKGTSAFPVYQMIRNGLRGYRFQVPNGEYKVTLHFCEFVYDQPGKRIFDVKLQKKTVLGNFDIAAKVGQYAALVIPFEKVDVTDGELVLDFVAKTDSSCISAIEISGPGYNKKINCGGNAYEDFEADVSTDDLPRNMPVSDFYHDWATAQFGPEVANETAGILTKLDGTYPKPATWHRGPGTIHINRRPWSQEKEQYAFAEKMEALQSQVRGNGNISRFDWWLNEFQYMKGMAELGCARGELDIIMERIEKISDLSLQRDSVILKALPVRLKMNRILENMYTHLLNTVNNASELGTITNIELQSLLRYKLLTAHDETIEKLSGLPLPVEAFPRKGYNGVPRLINLTVRTAQKSNESLSFKIIALDEQPVKYVRVKTRPLGDKKWQIIEAKNIGRAVWNVQLPFTDSDFEYQIISETQKGKKLNWPATAPDVNQTVVIQ